MGLTDFVSARLDEDEAVARAALTDDAWWVDGPAAKSGHWWIYPLGVKFVSRPAAEHIARNDPARVLAQVAAMRRIVDKAVVARGHEPRAEEMGWEHSITSAAAVAYEDALRLLASIWRDHPDFDPAWEV